MYYIHTAMLLCLYIEECYTFENEHKISYTAKNKVNMSGNANLKHQLLPQSFYMLLCKTVKKKKKNVIAVCSWAFDGVATCMQHFTAVNIDVSAHSICIFCQLFKNANNNSLFG